MDSDAARRAAAAEARRQKILARGAERLNRITVGTPLPIDSLLENVKTDLPAPVAVDSSLADADPAPAPRENDRINASVADIDVTDGTSVLEPSGAATLLASSDPMLQQILRRSDVQNFQNEEDMQKAYQNAEQALHVLLNQLAGPAGLPYLTQRQASETDAGAGSNAVSSSGRAEGTRAKGEQGSITTSCSLETSYAWWSSCRLMGTTKSQDENTHFLRPPKPFSELQSLILDRRRRQWRQNCN
ncbi:hypothetical protein Vretimale_17755 [Volvox reticuliferus]|uniref:Uncharacterized protein n=1 Tax=Volvox reticuliferus TaxID=1737510 RepID=A0A8J4GTK8_9CHLO|nr:hypothetical protein Vretifemale_18993 [Volvox reticuliferus]GIM14885.1 hypothetical protein Vretimale_17755 [Volvox reticuliferus]